MERQRLLIFGQRSHSLKGVSDLKPSLPFPWHVASKGPARSRESWRRRPWQALRTASRKPTTSSSGVAARSAILASSDKKLVLDVTGPEGIVKPLPRAPPHDTVARSGEDSSVGGRLCSRRNFLCQRNVIATREFLQTVQVFRKSSSAARGALIHNPRIEGVGIRPGLPYWA
jgi:hypothetical protein